MSIFENKYRVMAIVILVAINTLNTLYSICKPNKLEHMSGLNGINAEAISNIASLYNNKKIIADDLSVTTFNLLPKGVIVAWNGVSPPAGWALCDGKNGTPDLKGRFLMGFSAGHKSYGKIGQIGGNETVKLSTTEIPAHSHTFSSGGVTGHLGEYSSGHENENRSQFTLGAPRSPNHGDWYKQGQLPMTNTGGNGHHENRPPYYVLAFIMRL